MRNRDKSEILPWDFIDCGVTKKFLWNEWERAQKGQVTPNCRMGQEIIDVRRAIHKTPEVGKSLPKTKELVDTILVHENGNITNNFKFKDAYEQVIKV